MNATRIVILVLALVAAGGAAFLVQTFVLGREPEVIVAAAPEIDMVDVLVAARDFAAGETVNSGSLRWQRWPAEAVTPNFVTRHSNESARNDFEGAIVRRQISTGEPILPAALVQSGASGVMAALLSPGMRAMSVPVSDETAAGGFILPGDRVDVVLTREAGDDRFTQNYESATILNNVRVLAVDQTFDEDIEGGARVSDTATLEVTPAQAELLAMATEAGTISLTLRSFADLAEQMNDLTELPDILTSGGSTGEARRVVVLRNGQSNRVSVLGGM